MEKMYGSPRGIATAIAKTIGMPKADYSRYVHGKGNNSPTSAISKALAKMHSEYGQDKEKIKKVFLKMDAKYGDDLKKNVSLIKTVKGEED